MSLDIIRQQFPESIYKPPLEQLLYKKIIAYIVTKNHIVGYIDDRGFIRRIKVPIFNTSQNLPILYGVSTKDNSEILNILNDSPIDNNITELQMDLQQKTKSYNALYDSKNNEIILLKTEFNNIIDNLQSQLNTTQRDLENIKRENESTQLEFQQTKSKFEDCKSKILYEKDTIVQQINDYKENIKKYIKNNLVSTNTIDQLKKDLNNVQNERDSLNRQLDKLIQINQELTLNKELKENDEIDRNNDKKTIKKLQRELQVLTKKETSLQSEYSDALYKRDTLITKLDELNKQMLSEKKELEYKLNRVLNNNVSNEQRDLLQQNIDIITAELTNVSEELRRSNLKRLALEENSKNCTNNILTNKELVIERIREYNNKWKEWYNNTQENSKNVRSDLLNQISILKSELDNIRNQKSVSDDQVLILKRNIIDIENELKNTINKQLVTINERDEQFKLSQLESAKKDQVILELSKELEKLREQVYKANTINIRDTLDYDNCLDVLKQFISLNNIFSKKLDILSKISSIISNNIDVIIPDDSLKYDIINRFNKIKSNIENYITFLDLPKYINSPNLDLLKNNDTRSSVPKEFCDELSNILLYWNTNKSDFIKYSSELTSIYEDLSGSVRVYVRLKPDNENNGLLNIDNDNKLINFVCNGKESTFGPFYNIYDGTWNNKSIFNGNKSEIPDELTGLNGVFSQVQLGYSIILAGYGASGSGKSFSLLGNSINTGILEYGLKSLPGVKTIKLQYLFEQYVNSVNVNFAKLRGNIINLVNEIPQLREFSKDETGAFREIIPSRINLNNINFSDNSLQQLLNIINDYRIKKDRIRETPLNKTSSRSHLYFVFRIEFESGIYGWITIIDMAGQESPKQIFNSLLDTSKTSLATIMAPPPVGGENTIEKYKLGDDFSNSDIMSILREGFYINETLNHLIYYLHTKTNKSTKILLQSDNVDKYDTTKFYINPISEERVVNKSNNALTIPIFKFLDNLSKSSQKPSKFIILNTINEPCNETTLSSLRFSQLISN